MVLPNFLIIGAQRAGTTWLYQTLRRHPEVHLPQTKELEYFSYPERQQELGLAGYSREYFSRVRTELAVGEASPSYFWTSGKYPHWDRKNSDFCREIPRVVRESLGPDTRLVVSLRDPIRRAISAYLHHLTKGRLKDIQTVLEAGRFGGIVHMGFYFAHLEAWLEYFDRSKIFVSIFEDAVSNEEETYRNIFSFLGVNSKFTNPAMSARFNRGRTAIEIDGEFFIVDDPLAEDVADHGSARRRILSRDDLAQLREIYKSDLADLCGFLQRDLGPVWTTAFGA